MWSKLCTDHMSVRRETSTQEAIQPACECSLMSTTPHLQCQLACIVVQTKGDGLCKVLRTVPDVGHAQYWADDTVTM